MLRFQISFCGHSHRSHLLSDTNCVCLNDNFHSGGDLLGMDASHSDCNLSLQHFCQAVRKCLCRARMFFTIFSSILNSWSFHWKYWYRFAVSLESHYLVPHQDIWNI